MGEGSITGFIGDSIVDDHIVRSPSGRRFNGRDVAMCDILDLNLGFTLGTNMAQLGACPWRSARPARSTSHN